MVSLKMAFKMGERQWLLTSGNGFVGPLTVMGRGPPAGGGL